MADLTDQAFKRLNIRSGDKLILCLDGGGIRGIMTLQLLKSLEQQAGIPCHQLFDMVSGTSTGGIIAGLIALGKTAAEIEALYLKLVDQVFEKRSWVADRFFNPPAYTKKKYREILKQEIGATTTIEDVCRKTQTDLLITAKDVAEGEETFFSCFQDGDHFIGTYKDVLLRAVMEATMSAPTYFTPLERFVDGGVTTYNNPALAAIMEAVQYGPKGKYLAQNLTVFSLGTGARLQFVLSDNVVNPKGSDTIFWLKWIMSEAGDDASDMQNYLLRSGAFGRLDYRRFQISLDSLALSKLPNRPITGTDRMLSDISDEELANIALDNVKYFSIMGTIGEAMVDFIKAKQNPPFGQDLVDDQRKEWLVSRTGDIATIKKHMSDPVWLDKFET